MLTPTAQHYTLSELARRMGWTDDPASLPIIYGQADDHSPATPSLIIRPAAPETWQNLLTQAEHSLRWLPAESVMPPGQRLPIGESLPVLAWGETVTQPAPFAEILPNGSVVFHADVIAATFFMLSRWEEIALPQRDKHDRFPAEYSVAYRQGFLNRPIIDEYALILRAWLKYLRPDWTPKVSQFRIKLSHDIDQLRRFHHWRSSLRVLARYLLKITQPCLLLNALRDVLAQVVNPADNSAMRGLLYLGAMSHRYGLDSAFYFKASPVAPFDSGYNPADPLLQPALRQLSSWGFEFGFHPGYYTYDNQQNFVAEKDRLAEVLGQPLCGGRQHYLRFKVPDTWRLWEAAGFEYDSTLGYADHEGFRAGTCHPFNPFDLEQQRVIEILEFPLIVMETTLFQYQKLSAETSFKRILQLAEYCKVVDGSFTLLWHNTSFTETWLPWAQIYEPLLAELRMLGQK